MDKINISFILGKMIVSFRKTIMKKKNIHDGNFYIDLLNVYEKELLEILENHVEEIRKLL